MYQATKDPYCYSGTSVLKNRAKLRRQEELEKFEIFSVVKRSEEPLPIGRFDYRHYRAIHRHLFQDIYAWAGRIRTVRIAKAGSWFCYPENIDREMRRVFGEFYDDNDLRDLEAEMFAGKAAHFQAELNAVHPFREGNGRTQNVFLTIIADQAGHPLDLNRLHPPEMLDAMIASFNGDERPLSALILRLIRTR